MPHRLAILLAIATTLAPVACDEDAPTDAVEFREAPSLVLYRSQNVAPPMGLVEFATLVLECEGAKTDPAVAVTFTEYPTQYTDQHLRVLGLGFSALADDVLIECYRERMIKWGATP